MLVTLQLKKMAQVTITIPDSLEEYLRDVAEEEGMKFSSLAALCVQFGFSEYVERLNKYQVYKRLKSRLPQKGKPEVAKDEELIN